MINNRLVTILIIMICLAIPLACPGSSAYGQTEAQTDTEENVPDTTTTPGTNIPTASQVLSSNDVFTITKEPTEYDVDVYNAIVSQGELSEVLQSLADASGMRLTIDDHIDPSMLSSYVALYLEKAPLEDILEVVLGTKGLEFVIRDNNEIWITFPTKLSFDSPMEYLRDKAIQIYQKAQIKYPNSPFLTKAYFEIGKYYFNLGSYLLAIQEFQTIIESYPSDDLARHAMIKTGKCYEKLTDFENARHYYFQFIDTFTRDELLADVYLSIGDTWYVQEEYSKAISIYEKIINDLAAQANPATYELAQLQLGRSHMRIGDYEGALETFLEVREKLSSDKYRAEVEYQIGNCLYLMGNYEDSSAVLANLLVTELTNPMADDAYCKFADCAYTQKDYFGAIQAYSGVLASFPDSELAPRANYYLGMCYKELQVYNIAINVFLEGLDTYPTSPYGKAMEFALGQCYFEKEDFRHANETFDQYVIDGADTHSVTEAKYYSAESLFFEEKYNEAISAYKKMLTLEPDAVEDYLESIYKRIGDCYKEMGQVGKSILAYQGKELEE